MFYCVYPHDVVNLDYFQQGALNIGINFNNFAISITAGSQYHPICLGECSRNFHQ